MNPLAKLKEKLLVKPTVEDREKVAVVIKGVKKHIKLIDLKKQKEDVEAKPGEEGKVLSEEIIKEKESEDEEEEDKKATPLIVDETKKGYDRVALFKKLLESKKLKVTIKPILEVSEEKKYSEPLPLPVLDKKIKKVEIQNPLIIEEDEEGEEFVMKPKKVQFEEKEEDEEEFVMKPKKVLEEVIPIKAPKKKARITEKPEKGVAILGPETLVEIGDTDLRKRMPKKSPPVIIKVSNYYMNNREIYVNFINSIFEPYRKELAENTNAISCETIGKTSTNFSLLTHQKIVRDYMNVFTPYRGLLLYHGLGSGKCHAKNTPIMMSDGTIKLVQNIEVGDLLMGDDSKPRKVQSLARGKDKMYDVIPVKGNKYTVNEEHILCLKASGFPKFTANNHKSNYNYNIQFFYTYI